MTNPTQDKFAFQTELVSKLTQYYKQKHNVPEQKNNMV